MKLFGREPTLWLQAISGILGIGVALALPGLSAEQAALIIAALSALIGVLNAMLVWPPAPAAFTGFIAALAALAAGYGFEVSQEVVGAVQAATVVILGLITRNQVTPKEDARPDAQV